MNTYNVNAAYAEADERAEKGLQDVSQFVDLFCYVLSCSDTQKQPAKFVQPDGARALTMLSQLDGQQVSVWLKDGWPVAITDSHDDFYRVLSGIPEGSKPQAKKFVNALNKGENV